MADTPYASIVNGKIIAPQVTDKLTSARKIPGPTAERDCAQIAYEEPSWQQTAIGLLIDRRAE